MGELIEGLWIEMSSQKLRDILDGRRQHHTKKAAWYKQQADTITEEIDEDAISVSNNPAQSLRASQRGHEGKATFFGVLAENVISGATYRLSEQNCMRLELYSQYF